jgi:hypothetical protein
VRVVTQPPEERSDRPAGSPAPPQSQEWLRPEEPNAAAYPPAFQPIPSSTYPGGYKPNYAGLTPPAPPRNDLGTVSLVLGILGLCFSWVLFGGLMLGIGALATGIKARGRVKRGEATNNGVTIAGIVLGTVAIVVGAALVLLILGVVIVDQQECSQLGNTQKRTTFGRC